MMALGVGCGTREAQPRIVVIPQVPSQPSVRPSVVASARPQPVAPEVLLKRLAAISVVERLPDVLARADRGPGAPMTPTITLVIEHATPDMFVMTTGAFTPREPTYHLYDDPVYPSHRAPDVSAGGLAPYGATTAFSYAPSNTSFLLSVRIDHKPVPARTPGLVWSTEVQLDVPTVGFVTLDGMEHEIRLEPNGPSLVPAAGRVGEWAAPVSDPAFGRASFSVGLREKVASLDAVDTAFETCAGQAWKGVQQAMAPAKASESMLSGSHVKDACKKEIAAWEATMAKNFDADIKRRTALYDLSKARALASARSR